MASIQVCLAMGLLAQWPCQPGGRGWPQSQPVSRPGGDLKAVGGGWFWPACRDCFGWLGRGL